MTNKETLRRELAMQSAVAMTIIDALSGQKPNIPSTVANNFIIAYRQLGIESFKPIVQRAVDELEKSK